MFRPLTAITRAPRIHARTYAAATATPPSEPPKFTHSPSQIKPGTVLKDLSILKDKPDPIALPDEEYPAWLWTLTDEYQAGSKQQQRVTAEKGQGGFDLKTEKKKLRAT
ncbi:hypothetical protein QFC22_001752 [Naganishia vaughanmartiniae]|uniref:Uncharacterized protein n=1 Tax=Naganishia vaughanmartiniae TaxID=1424756 RepID=A0ACC2XFB9_9TREE|nr:hypothetical protein QFC22_001752 [Naganishia vaughanmartiniae]